MICIIAGKRTSFLSKAITTRYCSEFRAVMHYLCFYVNLIIYEIVRSRTVCVLLLQYRNIVNARFCNLIGFI